MRTENTTIGVGFIHDHESQGGKEGGPLFVMGEDGKVQHFRIGNQHIGWRLTDFSSEMVGSVSIIDGCGWSGRFGPVGRKRGKGPQLILCQCLEREKHQNTTVTILEILFEDGEAVTERFATGRRSGNHKVASGSQNVGCGCLMTVQGRDSPLFKNACNRF